MCLRFWRCSESESLMIKSLLSFFKRKKSCGPQKTYSTISQAGLFTASGVEREGEGGGGCRLLGGGGGVTFCANISTKETANSIRFLWMWVCVCVSVLGREAVHLQTEREGESDFEHSRKKEDSLLLPAFSTQKPKTKWILVPRKVRHAAMDEAAFGRASLSCTLLLLALQGKLRYHSLTPSHHTPHA